MHRFVPAREQEDEVTFRYPHVSWPLPSAQSRYPQVTFLPPPFRRRASARARRLGNTTPPVGCTPLGHLPASVASPFGSPSPHHSPSALPPSSRVLPSLLSPANCWPALDASSTPVFLPNPHPTAAQRRPELSPLPPADAHSGPPRPRPEPSLPPCRFHRRSSTVSTAARDHDILLSQLFSHAASIPPSAARLGPSPIDAPAAHPSPPPPPPPPPPPSYARATSLAPDVRASTTASPVSSSSHPDVPGLSRFPGSVAFALLASWPPLACCWLGLCPLSRVAISTPPSAASSVPPPALFCLPRVSPPFLLRKSAPSPP